MECTQQETPTATATAIADQMKLPKNCKENRYYYRHREEILERKRLARLAKKGIDVTQSVEELKETLEEKRKKKMEFLGFMSDKK